MLNRFLLITASVCISASGGCPSTKPVSPQNASDSADASSDAPPDTAVTAAPPSGPCVAAEAQMRKLGCVPRVARDAGTWLEVCTNARSHSIDLHTACRANALSCADVEACDNL